MARRGSCKAAECCAAWRLGKQRELIIFKARKGAAK